MQERILYLRDERIPELESAWQDDRDDETFMLLGRARDELDKLQAALASVEAVGEPRPAGGTASTGDFVVVREPDGAIATYLLVAAEFGRLEDSWLSVESPVGAALVGRIPGEVVEVSTPGGVLHYEIVDVSRAAA
jgi:transcription elongation GreA/GreB family factor